MVTRAAWLRTFLLLSLFALTGALTGQADTIKLKNGRTIKGQVVRFGNGEFLVLLERTDPRAPGQDRMIVLMENVDSIEFDAGEASAAAPAIPATPAEKVVVVDAQREVVSTGIQLRRGDKVRITASGEMQFPDGRVSGPEGLDTRESWPFPGERFGVLIAMVGDPQSTIYHVIGKSAEFEARSDGELFLQVNARSLTGARGAYTARVVTPQSAASTPATPATPTASSAPAATPAAPRQLRAELDVPANKEWVDTGLDLVEGDVLRIVATGTITFAANKSAGPNGAARDWRDLVRTLPVNDAGRGALIGKMGETGTTVKAFLVGDHAEFTAERTGRLFLGINDNTYDDNRGSFHVKIEIVPKR